jgi:hypothetical protein
MSDQGGYMPEDMSRPMLAEPFHTRGDSLAIAEYRYFR